MTVERLAKVARAAGFAMATPDDAYDTLNRQPAPRPARRAWRPLGARSIERQMAIAPPPPRTYSWRDLLASLSFRQPA